mmetsp:Transcript_32218/g.57799  ORF Transcript_32218/g.57799 Transcript_32218/m.57799 type:complete len:82 (+) Transcript_32218:131-376(+)
MVHWLQKRLDTCGANDFGWRSGKPQNMTTDLMTMDHAAQFLGVWNYAQGIGSRATKDANGNAHGQKGPERLSYPHLRERET